MPGHPVVTRRTVLLGALAALAGCSAPDGASGPARLVLATGPPGAVFREIGAALAEVLDRQLPETRVTALPSSASTENLRLLHERRAHIGFSSLDAAVGDSGEPSPDLSALGRVYDSHLHLVVAADSPVEAFEDLAGQRVSFGAKESGTEFTMRRLVELTGLDVEDVRMDQASSADALIAGDIDALFSLTGIPTPAVSRLAEDSQIRLVSLREEANRLADAYPSTYIPATIPATAYPGVAACDTVAIPNLLLARDDLPEETARLVTETVFTESAAIAADRPEAAHINVRTGIATGPVPLHPGAVRWFREQKA
ncbi:TAXI family TRAP transporter solute-binding subunit [Marinitenerispora sediminis]|uniref:TAXI family TRAP transporter solute-binding subunit n=1 Tax=Marinitenerispora sediminis TaxID=1931232 RepID=UPI0015F18A25|nr:TAXI family TRAP transporter solute-binding subunit [Marinitenerispora sediminis]